MSRKNSALSLLGAVMLAAASSTAAQAAEPVKIGCSMAMTGGVAVNGKQVLVGMQIWRDDVNAKGGLLGRPVQLICYDDQSSPATVPAIYTKLIEVDKVDLTVGPYATNMVVPALAVLMQHDMATVGVTALAANSQFHYPKYFSMLPSGPTPKLANSEGFFRLATMQNPRPRTIAISAADAEFAKNSTDGARENAKTAGLEVVYDKAYPPATTDFAPIVRAINATNPDIVYNAGYNPDSIGMIHAANEIGLNAKMFGGNMVGLAATATRMQLGPLLNGMVSQDFFSLGFDFPGLQGLLKTYAARAPGEGIDPLGYAFAPFGYAALQVLGQAVEATKGFDQNKLADYIHGHSFNTVAGEIAFGPDGEWTKSRVISTQFQHIAGNAVEQFEDPKKAVIVWPPEYRTGDFIYSFQNARK
ncbi:MAG TPA: amino acid ABC transporter substrate-binding protein [Stellaceae bacterium]|nr:amino acid ABC transporter substrate-binding protein [Stellaceae bacterium]